MNRFLASADRIVAASPNYLHTSDVLQQFQDKTRVIPYGLNKAGYPQPDNERINRWRQHLGNKFFLFVGVMRYYKGLHILLDAMKDVDYRWSSSWRGSRWSKRCTPRPPRCACATSLPWAPGDEDKVALLQ